MLFWRGGLLIIIRKVNEVALSLTRYNTAQRNQRIVVVKVHQSGVAAASVVRPIVGLQSVIRLEKSLYGVSMPWRFRALTRNV